MRERLGNRSEPLFPPSLRGLTPSRDKNVAGGGAHDQNEAFRLMPGGEHGLGGGESGLAPLARTVEDDVLGSGGEDEGLDGVGLKVEALASEADGVEGVADVKKWGHWDPGVREGNEERGPRCRELRGSREALSLWRRGGPTNRGSRNIGRRWRKIGVFGRLGRVRRGAVGSGWEPSCGVQFSFLIRE